MLVNSVFFSFHSWQWQLAAPVFNFHRVCVWDIVGDCDLCCVAEHIDFIVRTQSVPFLSK